MARLVDGTHPAALEYRAAIGLAYLGDANTLDLLLDAVAKTRSDTVRAILSRTVAALGDRRALTPLLRQAEARKATSKDRRRALDALGMLGEDAEVAWNASLGQGYNFTAPTPSVSNALRLF